MSELCLLAVSLLAQGQTPGWQLTVPLLRAPVHIPSAIEAGFSRFCDATPKSVAKAELSAVEVSQPEFSSQTQIQLGQVQPIAHYPNSTNSDSSQTTLQPNLPPVNPNHTDQSAASGFIPVAPTRPLTGGQLYQQRLAALRAGRTYTRLPVDSFQDQWINATEQPTHQQWVSLLQQEAAAMAKGQGNGRLSVLLGDSLSLWFPTELLARDRFWLNQGISGDTTTGVLQRLSAIQDTNPDVIHVMVGINDLRRGATDTEVVSNLREIMRQLRYSHPDAQIIVHSILPTRLAALPTDRIRRLNYMIANTTTQEGVDFLNLHYAFNDEFGILRRDLTTDGIHLSLRGYESWGAVMSSIF
jgi:lysophospholipase L1-like esterase